MSSLLNLTDIDGTPRLTVSDGGILTCWGITADVTGNVTGTAGGIDSAARYQSPTDVTATGSAQNIAHGLGATPVMVWAEVVAGTDGAGGAGTQFPTVTLGTHTSTNIVITVTAGAKFRVYAIK